MYSLKRRNQLHYLSCGAKLETQTLTRLCLRCYCSKNPKADRETKNISRTVVFVVAGVIALAPGENVKIQNVRAGFREDVFTKKVICSVRLASLHPPMTSFQSASQAKTNPMETAKACVALGVN